MDRLVIKCRLTPSSPFSSSPLRLGGGMLAKIHP